MSSWAGEYVTCVLSPGLVVGVRAVLPAAGMHGPTEPANKEGRGRAS